MDGHSLTMFDKGNLLKIIREILVARNPNSKSDSSSHRVHASVLIPHPYDFKINLREVERLVRIPLAVFFSDDSLYKRDWAEIEGNIYHGTVYQYHSDVIRGATARIMQNFVDVVRERLDLPVEKE